MKTKPYVVLVGMDFSELADRALQHAFELAARRELSEVHVACVIPSPGMGGHQALTGYALTSEAGVRDGAFESLRAHVQAKLDAFVARAPASARVPEQVVSHLRIGAPAAGLIALSAAISADLIVLGRHGHHGPQAMSMGSTAENTLRFAACAVLVIPVERVLRVRLDELSGNPLSVAPCSARHRPSARAQA